MLAVVVIIGVFAGCGNSQPPSESGGSFAETTKPGAGPVPDEVASPLALYRISDGLILKLGNNRDYIAKVVGPDEAFVATFEEDNLERVQYWDNEEFAVDYDPDGIARSIRIDEGTDWKVFNGLGIGSTREEVRKQYMREAMFSYPQTQDVWVSYDENSQLTEFSDKAAYIVRFKIKDGKVQMIIIMDNTLYDWLPEEGAD